MEVDGEQFKLGFAPLEALYIQDGLSPEDARATALSWGNGWTF